MQYTEQIKALLDSPQALEQLYRTAQQRGEESTFQAAIEAAWRAAPQSQLLAAWHYRLQAEPRPRESGTHWRAAIPISVLTGLLFWALSDVEHLLLADSVPHLLVVWAPLAAVMALVFLTWTGREPRPRRLAALTLGLLGLCAFVVWGAPALLRPVWDIQQYLDLTMAHLPLLSWGALGLLVLGLGSPAEERFAFLIKSVEVVITAGLYLLAGGAFAAITVGLFSALGVDLSEMALRLLFAGGFGLLPVLAVATVYDPSRSPAGQDFSQGLSRFIHTLMRLLLVPTLVVLVIYVLFIPLHFMQPFQEREVLLVYNVMLFAVMGLLLGALPVSPAEVPAALRTWLRRGMVAVGALAMLVSVYAMAAIVYRTVTMGGMTMNRLVVIGWNSINITLLGTLLYRQARSQDGEWVYAMQRVFALGTNAYLLWALFIVLFVPLLF